MAFNGSGTFTVINTFVYDTVISETDMNTNLADIATGLSTVITKNGQTTTTTVIPFASGLNTDTIGEITGAAGVTVDGVLLKDGRTDTTKGADIASATTTDIGAATGNYVDITGTTTITGLGTIAAGAKRSVQFDGILTLTHNGTSLILPGAADITTAAGDTAGFVSLGSGNWKCEWYTAASGQALVGGAAASTTVAGIVELATAAETAAGTDATLALTPGGLNDVTDVSAYDWFLDEDDLVGDDATKVASQQSIKAYVDAQIAAAGSLEFVATAAIPAQATFEIAAGGTPDITHAIAAGYDYIIQLKAFCGATDLKDLYMRYSDDGGATYEAGASDYGWGVSQGGIGIHDETTTQIQMTENMGNDAGNMSTLTITLTDPGGTSEPLTADWSGGVGSADSPPYREPVVGYGVFDKGAGAVDGVQFLWETSSLFKAQGDVTIWRRKRS